MKDTGELKKSNEKDERILRSAFLKGMSEVLILDKKTKSQIYNYTYALNHDVRFHREDLIKSLVKLIKDLCSEEKIELKNKILELEMDEDVYNAVYLFGNPNYK